MILRPPRQLRSVASAIALVSLVSCVFVFQKVETTRHDAATQRTAVLTPVKAHLGDGRTAVFESGATFDRDSMFGTGNLFDLALRTSTPVWALSLGDVVGLESFSTHVDVAASLVFSTVATAGGAALGAALAFAIFGSCPTIYSDSASSWALEAEGFSYSIAPLFERRDVDRLRALPDDNGMLRLELRNEALETHYIEYIELLDARHALSERVVPDGDNNLLAVRALQAPTRARDRAGRNVRGSLVAQDRVTFSTDRRTISNATLVDLEDYIELEFPVPVASDSVALVLTLRNSLLNTVLLYDVMLGASGAHALGWMENDLKTIAGAAALGRWYGARMGARIAVLRDGHWIAAGSIPDAGPIAWREMGIMIPVTRGDPTVRVRLSFVADQWRFDRIALATTARRLEARTVALARVKNADGLLVDSLRTAITDADGRYLRTTPGQRLTLEFEAGRSSPDSGRTVLIASQGYYTEWVRPDWVRTASRDAVFTPGDSAYLTALRRWDSARDSLERRFYSSKIPVR